MRRTILLAAALCAALSLPARADDAAPDADRRAAARAVLNELHSGDMVNALVPNILAQIRMNLTRGDPTLLKEFDSYAPHLKEQAESTKPVLMDKLVEVYAKTFTTDELKNMLSYYQSPIGQRIISTQGAINQGMLAAAREWGTDVAKTMATDAAAKLQGTTPPVPDTPAAPAETTAPADTTAPAKGPATTPDTPAK